ncbi:MAG TPA: MarR family transcriptional regulator [Phenylobacterium sp.]|nr:MarR family transcriptional regulator [Phenylobacterium sp.]
MSRKTDRTNPDSSAAPAAAEALRLDRQLCFALYAASGLVTRAYRPLLEPLGLTYPQYLAMLVLWEASPRSVGELGEALGLDSGTLTPLLKRMAAAGLVTRTRDPADERRVLIGLTDQGQALRDRAATIPETLACALPMPAAELVELRTTLQDFARKLRASGA